jgi:hypothetical protein
MQTPPSDVGTAEVIYRRVKYGRPKGREHYVKEGDKLRVTSVAFQHPSGEVSVNRADYCKDGPHDLVEEPTDGVVWITAGRTREFRRVVEAITFNGEVTGSPLVNNAAHAAIHLAPHRKPEMTEPEKKAFNRFCEYMKKIANSNWAIDPPEPSDGT